MSQRSSQLPSKGALPPNTHFFAKPVPSEQLIEALSEMLSWNEGSTDHGAETRAGPFRWSSSSQAAACASEGARQSPRGDRAPPDDTFGPLGMADRLNCEVRKKRSRKTPSHFAMVCAS